MTTPTRLRTTPTVLQLAMRLFLKRQSDALLVIFLLGVLGVMFVPLPPFGLDLLLSMNLMASIALLLTAVYVASPTQLSSFPSILLLSTMLRLALNISSTRSILLKGEAGHLIHTIGSLVVGGDLVVGLVVFLILTLIQFLVVVKGAERVAEVSARFTLDAMPGKQMSIDADARAGTIEPEEANRRRDALNTESQLYGAMDGAMKFIKGDTIAGLVITAINLIGGVLIGVVRYKMTIGDALDQYSILSVGDALVAQIPSMLTTLCSGLVVTRVSNGDSRASVTLGHALHGQLLANPRPLAFAGGFVLLLGFIPGMPTFVFFALGAGGLGLAYVISKPMANGAGDDGVDPYGDGANASASANAPEQRQEMNVAKAQRASLDEMLPMVTPILLELAPALATELNNPSSRFVSELLPNVRNALFFELGIRCTTVRMRANPYLGENLYAIYVNEVPGRVDSARVGQMLVGETAERLATIGVKGESAFHPLTGSASTWVPEIIGMKLKEAGIAAWSYDQYIAMDLQATLHRSASDLLGMHDVQEMLDQLEQVFPAMVREVVPKMMTLSRLTDVLKRLIDEGVSIRNLKGILESIARWGTFFEDNAVLVERIRADLRDAISFKYGGVNKSISAFLLSPAIEDAVGGAIHVVDGAEQLTLDPELAQAIVDAVKDTIRGSVAGVAGPIFLTRPDIRRHVREMLRTDLAGAVVLSYRDLRPELVVEPIARIEVD